MFLPIRGRGIGIGLTFSLGKWEGWYFSEQLKFAKENGYKIKIFRGYSFNKGKSVFTH